MNLAAKRCAWLRDDFVMRLGAFLMVIGLLFSLLNPPKAKAIAVVDDILVVASVFFQACGLTWSLQGAMEQSGFTNAVAGLLTDYLAADFAGQTPAQWAGDIGASIAPGGKLMIPKLLAQKLGAFANWVVQKKAITAGGPNVSISSSYGKDVTFLTSEMVNAHEVLNGSVCFDPPVGQGSAYFSNNRLYFKISAENLIKKHTSMESFSFVDVNGKIFTYSCNLSAHVCYINGVSFSLDPSYKWFCFFPVNMSIKSHPETVYTFLTFAFSNDSTDYPGFLRTFIVLPYRYDACIPDLFCVVKGPIAVALHPEAAIDIPDTSTMADNESIAIDTAITAGTTAELLQRILDAIMAGTLTATKEIAKEEPKPGEITDVNELGLPSLAAIITTRFPFSIPWDVVKGFKLLSAPAKTPHWEVDFYGAVSGMVPGGWKGDTRIVIDFSKFEVLGQLSRWTSTIGFCLFLAMGTKKLSWVS